MVVLNMEGFGMINNERKDVEKEDNKNPGDDKAEDSSMIRKSTTDVDTPHS